MRFLSSVAEWSCVVLKVLLHCFWLDRDAPHILWRSRLLCPFDALAILPNALANVAARWTS
jgi:hypothetical protein